jgi:hypothetical protein
MAQHLRPYHDFRGLHSDHKIDLSHYVRSIEDYQCNISDEVIKSAAKRIAELNERNAEQALILELSARVSSYKELVDGLESLPDYEGLVAGVKSLSTNKRILTEYAQGNMGTLSITYSEACGYSVQMSVLGQDWCVSTRDYAEEGTAVEAACFQLEQKTFLNNAT